MILIAVYNTSSSTSFKSVCSFLLQTRLLMHDYCTYLLVGLTTGYDSESEVLIATATEFARKNNMLYYQINHMDYEEVDDIFNQCTILAEKLLDSIEAPIDLERPSSVFEQCLEYFRHVLR